MAEFELGIWRAEAAEAAEAVEGGGMDCERGLDKPGDVSVLDIGQRYLTRDFREASALELDWTAEGPVDEAETAVAVEDVEAREVDELDRGAVFLEGINIL
jgi:hypothetical protein